MRKPLMLSLWIVTGNKNSWV